MMQSSRKARKQKVKIGGDQKRLARRMVAMVAMVCCTWAAARQLKVKEAI